ncbi:MAG TPA: hypothetical protein VEH06_05485 [Candidatus Bathyarchaeia archaeon]|nr:hypothetical protein [Candidatus Bathyarchaeia archaeon]
MNQPRTLAAFFRQERPLDLSDGSSPEKAAISALNNGHAVAFAGIYPKMYNDKPFLKYIYITWFGRLKPDSAFLSIGILKKQPVKKLDQEKLY